ncbi:MAG TPA: Arm DNA-binding domain-containing protein, partial [Rhizomicrobium sp.]
MLTALGIEKLKPREKSYKVSDGNGLYILVEPTGGKLWPIRYSFGGKEKMLSLGSFPEVSLA